MLCHELNFGAEHVVLLAVVLLVALFAFQSCGTSKVGFCFSPIMVTWFVSNAAIGIYNIIRYHPSILKGLSPLYIYKFFERRGKTAWDILGAVFLSITGTVFVSCFIFRASCSYFPKKQRILIGGAWQIFSKTTHFYEERKSYFRLTETYCWRNGKEILAEHC